MRKFTVLPYISVCVDIATPFHGGERGTNPRVYAINNNGLRGIACDPLVFFRPRRLLNLN